MKAKSFLAVSLLALILALAAGQFLLQEKVEALQSGMVEVPLFEVDPFWPKPLPNHWILGNAIGVGIDSRDHVFIVHRRQSLNPGNEGNVGSDQNSGIDLQNAGLASWALLASRLREPSSGSERILGPLLDRFLEIWRPHGGDYPGPGDGISRTDLAHRRSWLAGHPDQQCRLQRKAAASGD